MNNENNGTVIAAETTGAEIEGGEGYQGAEVTAMDNTTTTEATDTTTTPAAETTAAPAAKPARAKKQKAPPRVYPFLTKAQIGARIESDFGFACEVIGILYQRQTQHEQDTKSTLSKNRRGFMSSHAVHGSRIAQLLASGSPLNDEDKARVAEIAPRYTKQMADHFRAEAIRENPELEAQAACFFTDQG